MMISLFIHGVVRVPKIWCYCKRFPTAKCDQTGNKIIGHQGVFLKSANILIENNPHVFEKRLFSELGYGDELRVLTANNESI